MANRKEISDTLVLNKTKDFLHLHTSKMVPKMADAAKDPMTELDIITLQPRTSDKVVCQRPISLIRENPQGTCPTISHYISTRLHYAPEMKLGLKL